MLLGTTHSVRFEEQLAFSDWVNTNLGHDPDLRYDNKSWRSHFLDLQDLFLRDLLDLLEVLDLLDLFDLFNLLDLLDLLDFHDLLDLLDFHDLLDLLYFLDLLDL